MSVEGERESLGYELMSVEVERESLGCELHVCGMREREPWV